MVSNVFRMGVSFRHLSQLLVEIAGVGFGLGDVGQTRHWIHRHVTFFGFVPFKDFHVVRVTDLWSIVKVMWVRYRCCMPFQSGTTPRVGWGWFASGAEARCVVV